MGRQGRQDLQVLRLDIAQGAGDQSVAGRQGERLVPGHQSVQTGVHRITVGENGCDDGQAEFDQTSLATELGLDELGVDQLAPRQPGENDQADGGQSQYREDQFKGWQPVPHATRHRGCWCPPRTAR